MKQLNIDTSNIGTSSTLVRLLWISLGIVLSLLVGFLKPALAHHSADIGTFNPIWTGILHPLRGIDHLCLIMAAGCIAARKSKGLIWAFTASALIGIAAGLLGINLPSTVVVAMALLLVGALLTQSHAQRISVLLWGISLAGFCHGYPHAALLTTATASAQTQFLLSFTLMQIILGYLISYGAKGFLQSKTALALPGIGIFGVGLVYLSSLLV